MPSGRERAALNLYRAAGAVTIAGFQRTGTAVAHARYLHLDVFAASPGGGNHLGVVLDAAHWSDAAMQRFARWNNLVETTFLLAPTRPEASYRVRIFTPRQEIPFASHPSIGSAHALLECGLAQPRDGLLWQECGAGVLPMRVEGEGTSRCLLLRPPPEQIVGTGLDAHPLLDAALGGIRIGRLPPALVEGGRKWWLAEVAGEAELRAWQPDHGAIGALARATDSMGLCAFARRTTSSVPALVVRAFPAGVGITEDPASGAANGLIAAYLAKAEPGGPFAKGYVVSQGREVGHDAELIVRMDGGEVWVGGRTHTIVRGTLDWDPA
jgi:PhzF family phenazine biosynthesis protein